MVDHYTETHLRAKPKLTDRIDLDKYINLLQKASLLNKTPPISCLIGELQSKLLAGE